MRELSREIDAHLNAVRRELVLLLKADIVIEVDGETANQGNEEAGSALRKYYMLNENSLVFSEMQALLGKAEVMVEKQFVEKIKESGGDIKLFVLTGRFVNDKETKTDMLLVGKIKEKNVAKLVVDYEKSAEIEVRYTTMTEEEFLDRRYLMDKFVYSIFEGERIKVIDKLNI